MKVRCIVPMHMSFGAVFFLLFTWSPLTSDLQKMSQTKKTHQYEGAMKLMILVLEDNQLTKQNQKLLLTTYVFSGLIDVLFANVFILFRAIKESDARM